MKKILSHTVFIVALFAVASCSKSSTTGSVMSAKVNGVAWGSSNTTVTFNKVPALGIIINAQATGITINFELNPYTGIGTYPVSSSTNTYYESNGVYNHGNSGVVQITDSYTDGLNKTIIKGNFNFVTDNNDSVTNGQFEVALDLN